MIQFEMQLLLACLLGWSCCVTAKEIIISEKGSDTPSCLEKHNQLVSCQSLVNVSKHVTSHKLNNVTIRINDTNYTLPGVANFSGVENVTITGNSHSLAHIYCNSLNTDGAGIAFDRSSHITLKNFTISNCGAAIYTYDKFTNLAGNGTAIQMVGCFQVNVLGIVVRESISQGLTFINTGSTVRIIDSHFINNTLTQSQWLGGGALQIIFYGTILVLNNTYYTIANSTFKYNSATTNKQKIFNSKYYEKGGGIRIILFDNTCTNCNITLDNNTLEGNFAVFGGGALICVSGSTSNSKIRIFNNSFIDNNATAGGGGLDVGYTTYNPTNNTVTVLNSSFIGNIASYGGGLSTYTSSVRHVEHYNHFNCINCLFESNSAQCGAAVSASRGIFTRYGSKYVNQVCFTNCTFKNNVVTFESISSILDGNQNGAFFISEVEVTFAGETNFTGNNGTALYLDSTYYSTYAQFDTNSFVNFSDNSGYQGGAMVLFGKSAFSAGDNSYFYFYNNTATKFGGAICALTSKRIFSNMYLKTCFLKVRDLATNVFFHFHSNKATIGIDIYTTSIEPCTLCHDTIDNSCSDSSFFEKNRFGNFTFTDSGKRHVATSPKNFTIDFQDKVMPGIAAPLKIVQYDEVGGDVSQLFPFTIRVQSSIFKNAKVDSYTHNSIIILGFPKDEGKLLLESTTFTLIVRFQLSSCGPGFVFDNESLKCECSNNYNRNQIQCVSNGSAAIANNYWAGYKNVSNATPDNFLTGLCVTQLCNPTNCNDDDQLCSLPPTADAQELEKLICGENRHGRLCGRCVPNKSVYYHSDNFKCGDNTSCQYGIPIYIASELLPVTIIFLIILLFNISLTSGAVYSFVFYVQILSRLNITAFRTIHIKDHFTRGVVDFFQLVLGVLSFERSGPPLEFCIIQTDSIMNLFMIKYATLAYAFFLVLATILIMRIHSCYSCVKVCRRCGRRNIRGSIVDGLSAFLVLCYFQCAVVTSQILTPSKLRGINYKWYTTVSLFDGELDYLKGAHLWYAVPAFLCMIFILIPPPTILILEPILTKLFSMDCFTSTPPKWYYNRLRLKLMPFLDSFQACFRDRHRYFAGLYFLYRLLFITITSIIIQGPQYYYGFVTCLFMVIILLHVFLQPYKKRWHDLLEISLFITIISLLIITLYNFAFNQSNGTVLINVQLFLIFISIGYMVVYIAINVYQKLVALKMKKETRPVSREFPEVNESLPYRLLNDNNEVTISNSYRTF